MLKLNLISKVAVVLVLSLLGGERRSVLANSSSPSFVRPSFVSTQYELKTRKSVNLLSVAEFPRGGAASEVVSSSKNVLEWIGASPLRCWVVLMIAIALEISATSFMKVANDTENDMYLVLALFLYVVCLSMFGITLKQIEMSIAYAVWSGLGTALVTAVGMLVFNETRNFAKILCVAMILFGCVGLNLVDPASH